MDSEDKKKSRAARFSKKQNTEFGLASRGDNTLKLTESGKQVEYFISLKRRFTDSRDEKDTQQVLAGLRKLREALLSSKPSQFSVNVSLYSIQVSVRLGHYQTYIPCCGYLIDRVIKNPQFKGYLKAREISEVVEIYAIHLGHLEESNLNLCFQMLQQYVVKTEPAWKLLQAKVDSNYFQWFKAYSEYRHQKVVEVSGKSQMTKILVASINQAYFQIDKSYVETLLAETMSYEQLTRSQAGCQKWTLTGDRVIVKQRKV